MVFEYNVFLVVERIVADSFWTLCKVGDEFFGPDSEYFFASNDLILEIEPRRLRHLDSFCGVEVNIE